MTLTDIKRTMTRNLERLGTTPEGASIKSFETTDLQYEAWIYESLHACAEALERGERVLAFRCILQAHRYQGRASGHWPTPATHDAFSALKQSIEDLLS